VDGTRSALIVASDEYTDPGLRRLRAPASDAQALEGVLRDPTIGGFEVRTLLNQPAHEINLAVEEFFAHRRPDDLLLVHFSCHGSRMRAGSCTLRPRTPGCAGWGRPPWRPSSSTAA
jgi:Caspase domain